jgi:hypothetical protein
MRGLKLFSAIACLLPAYANAVQGERMGFSIAPNLGFVSPGMGGGIDLNIHNLSGFNHKIRMSGSEELSSGVPDSIDAHYEMGYLIGRWKRNHAGYLSASVGIGVVETTDRGREIVPPTCFLTSCTAGTYEMKKSKTVGVPFQFEAILMRNFIGIGLSILGNINPDRSYGGVVLEIPLGWTPL